MKYKLLLLGKNQTIIDDFFVHLSEDFTLLTTSTRLDDMKNHISIFNPDAFVFCMHKEVETVYSTIINLRNTLERYNIPVIIIGGNEDCELFQRKTYNFASLVIDKPSHIRNVKDSIISFFIQAKNTTTFSEPIAPDGDNISYPNLKSIIQETNVEAVSSSKKHILAIDDDPLILKLLKEQLKDNYTVATAISGSVALKFLESKTTDLILLDYEMPVMNGVEVLKRLRDNPATSEIPVIFLTGIRDSKTITEAINLKPQGYLLKPLERDALLSRINEVIGQ